MVAAWAAITSRLLLTRRRACSLISAVRSATSSSRSAHCDAPARGSPGDRARWVRTRARTTGGEIGLWMKSLGPSSSPAPRPPGGPAR